jgi:hypothetical protein
MATFGAHRGVAWPAEWKPAARSGQRVDIHYGQWGDNDRGAGSMLHRYVSCKGANLACGLPEPAGGDAQDMRIVVSSAATAP